MYFAVELLTKLSTDHVANFQFATAHTDTSLGLSEANETDAWVIIGKQFFKQGAPFVFNHTSRRLAHLAPGCLFNPGLGACH